MSQMSRFRLYDLQMCVALYKFPNFSDPIWKRAEHTHLEGL